jgi:hypothetical protein
MLFDAILSLTLALHLLLAMHCNVDYTTPSISPSPLATVRKELDEVQLERHQIERVEGFLFRKSTLLAVSALAPCPHPPFKHPDGCCARRETTSKISAQTTLRILIYLAAAMVALCIKCAIRLPMLS